MKKALMVASVASMIDQFNMRNIAILEQLGYQVEVAANFSQGSNTSNQRVAEFREELTAAGRVYHQVDIPRSVFKVGSILRSLKQVKTLCDREQYDLIHCHSPIGGVVARLAARKVRKKGTKVIYTAHGFHFFKGAPLKNWLLFYPMERLCSRITDLLITINQEDYDLAKRKMKAAKVVYVPGIGVNTAAFSGEGTDLTALREEQGLDPKDKVVLSVGELSRRKNHKVVLEAIARVPIPTIHYLICGIGPEEENLRLLAKELGMEDRLHLLGFRRDIPELLALADVYAFPSLQEGLPVALMEAMAAGKAVVCSGIRGNRDLIEPSFGGEVLATNDVEGFAHEIGRLLSIPSEAEKMGFYNRRRIKDFDRTVVDAQMKTLYQEITQ